MSSEPPTYPPAPHLDEEQLEAQRKRLLAMREHMVLLLSRTEEDTKPVELGSSFGRLSRIDAIQMRGMAEMSRRQLEVRRQLVELALSALGSGTYGSCRHCGATIGFRRLQALPETPFCVDCQEGFERER